MTFRCSLACTATVEARSLLPNPVIASQPTVDSVRSVDIVANPAKPLVITSLLTSAAKHDHSPGRAGVR